MPEHANTRPSGSEVEPTRHRFGTRRLRELLATRGDAGLWLAEDDDGNETLLRLYPGLPTMEEWHALDRAASERAYVADPRLLLIEEIGLDVWPHVTFAAADAESLARRIAREPMTPAAAVVMCADVAAALAALQHAGVPPVDVSPADIVLVGEGARLLPDVGLPGGALAHACVDLDYVAPERAAVLADPRGGVRAALRGAANPTAETMTYALASIVAAAIQGPPDAVRPTPTPRSIQLEQVLIRGLAQRPSERFETPAALVEALRDASGVQLPSRRVSARHRTARSRGARTAVARRRRASRRRSGLTLPVAVLLVAAAVGTVAGLPTTTSDPSAAAVTLAGAGLSVEVPRGWLRAGAGEGPPTLGDPEFTAHPPGPSTTTALVVTRAAAPLLAQLVDAAPEAVRLGDDDAWRYRDVAVGTGSVADVYVIEDGDGPIVAACLGPSDGPASTRAECAAALTTVRVDAGQAVALGGDAAARRELAQVVDALDRTRARERRALAAAATGRQQAAAADRLAAAYARAAAGAGKAGTVGAPGELPRLVARLEETGQAYAALATAARTTRRTAFTQAGENVVAHERALSKDLAALAPAGSRP